MEIGGHDMPVPNEHVEQLRELARLFEGLERFSRSSKSKEQFAELRRISENDDLVRILNIFYESEEERREAAHHPRRYFAQHGIEVPETIDIDVHPNNWCVSLCFIRFKSALIELNIGVEYDSGRGAGFGCC